jgi:hypothetical protein
MGDFNLPVGGNIAGSGNINIGNVNLGGLGDGNITSDGNIIVKSGAFSVTLDNTGNLITSGANGNISGAYVISAEVVKTVPTTVGVLPLANTVGAGSRAFVTDANTVTFGSTIAGGAGNSVPVYSDGTDWRVG